MAGEAAGGSLKNYDPLITDESVPPLVREALNSLLAGARSRLALSPGKRLYPSGGG